MLGNIRKAVVAGRFYPAEREQLLSEVNSYFAAAGNHRTECADYPVLGCMVPHAGYMFSGIVAGLTLGQIKVPETVLILSPNHTGRGANLSLWPDGAWRTPLGDVPVDSAGVERLVELSANKVSAPEYFMQRDTAAHTQDHAIEVILPFLQALQANLQIIPLCVRSVSPEAFSGLAESLGDFVRERNEAGNPVLLLTSSDMSHYLPHEEGKKLDRMALEQVARLDGRGLFKLCRLERISMCGFVPMSIMLEVCRSLGASRCCITAHTSSGVTGRDYGADMSSVVGYAGVIIN